MSAFAPERANRRRRRHLHNVIPAQAGIQTRFSDVHTLSLDSRLRGNDTVAMEGVIGHPV